MSILRVGRRGGLFLLKQPYRDCVDLTGGSPRRWVLIETAYDNGGRARRILRHMARGGARRQRDNETTRQRDNDDDNNFWPWFSPPHIFAHGKHKPFGYPPHSDVLMRNSATGPPPPPLPPPIVTIQKKSWTYVDMYGMRMRFIQ